MGFAWDTSETEYKDRENPPNTCFHNEYSVTLQLDITLIWQAPGQVLKFQSIPENKGTLWEIHWKTFNHWGTAQWVYKCGWPEQYIGMNIVKFIKHKWKRGQYFIKTGGIVKEIMMFVIMNMYLK